MREVSRIWRLGVAAALVALVPASAAALELTARETSAFRIKAPARWELQKKEASTAGGKHGSWVFKSPTRDGKLYVRVGAHRAGPIGAQWDSFVGERLSQSAKKITPQGYFEKKDGNDEVAFGTVYGVSRRNVKGHIYKFAVAILRSAGRKRAAYVTLAATEGKWSRLSQEFHRILHSLELK